MPVKSFDQTQRDAECNLEMLRKRGWPVNRLNPIAMIAKIVVAMLVVGFLCFSFVRMGLSASTIESVNALRTVFGGTGSSHLVDAAGRFLEQGWPPVIARERETTRIEGFDSSRLPWLSQVRTRETSNVSLEVVDGAVIEREVILSREVLVEPYGYLFRVAWLTLETIEIAMWGTLLAVLLGVPLSLLASQTTSPGRPVIYASRALCSLCRAIPELVSALFFVLLFGFGATAGVLALGLHSAGFLGKFFADDLDNADPGPALALASSGVGKFEVFRHALLPQVFPQYLTYLQYILERNVRTATVLGIVGAGGIGVELMGKWNDFQYGHATTVLLAIFISVVALEAITQAVRKKLIRAEVP